MREQNIWLCRHGNRIDFVDRNWKGSDPHLSVDGVEQAKQTGERLRGEGICHIFASPFLRTVETAHYIAEAIDIPIWIEHGACEWLYDKWFLSQPDFLPPAAMKERFPRVDTAYRTLVVPQYPETTEQLQERCNRLKEAFESRYTNNFLMIGHGASVVGVAAGYGFTLSGAGLCALTKIQRRGDSYTLELDASAAHLASGEVARDKFAAT